MEKDQRSSIPIIRTRITHVHVWNRRAPSEIINSRETFAIYPSFCSAIGYTLALRLRYTMANDSLTRAHIVGDVLDPFVCSVPLTMIYDGRPVFNGVEFRSSAVTLKPRVEIGGDDFRVAYTLVSQPLCTPKYYSIDGCPYVYGDGVHLESLGNQWLHPGKRCLT